MPKLIEISLADSAREIGETWACRVGAHDSCGGLGFRVEPEHRDLPCICPCHLPRPERQLTAVS